MSRSKLTKSKADVLDLEARFLDGERLTTEQILRQYFKPKNYLEGLQDKATVKGYLGTLKKRFSTAHNNTWFGCLNELGHYGIPNNFEEFRFSIEGYRTRIIGQVRRTIQIYTNGVDKKVLQPTMRQRLLLPTLEGAVKEAKK